MSSFLNAMQSHNTTTFNGAISHSTSGNKILDYFAKSGVCRGRKIEEVDADLNNIFSEDKLLALKTIFYNRAVTRNVKGINDDNKSSKPQRGQGQKDEFVKSLAWLEKNHPDILLKNLSLVPLVGCWKDLWYDSSATGYHNYVSPKHVYALIKIALSSEAHRALIAKYLPKIRSAKSTTNDRHRRKNAWARGLCQFLGWTEEEYRKFKSSPENSAHTWQRLMSSNDWNSINFNTIPGRALAQLVGNKGKDGKTVIERHNLNDSYLAWIKGQPVAKFTGYPYELYMKAKSASSLVEKLTYDAQFEGLLALAKEKVNPALLKKGVLCALDTSGSMGCMGYYGRSSSDMKVAPIDVCVGLGIYFSSLIEGSFKNHVVMFDHTSRMLRLSGTFTEKCKQIPSNAMGGTNFQSVIDEIVRVRKANPNIPVEDYPGVLLVVSDMQFNPASVNYFDSSLGYNSKTNYEVAMKKLAAVGLPKMTIIWWYVNSYGNEVPAKMDDEGTVLISGMDGAIVSTILEGDNERVVDEKTGTERKLNPYEMMVKALDQEVLNLLSV